MHWLMTPGRDDVFGFLMGENGFLYPWPRSSRRPPLRQWNITPAVTAAQAKAAAAAFLPDDAESAHQRAVEDFDVKVLAHPPMARPDSVAHQWHVLHDHTLPLLLRVPGEPPRRLGHWRHEAEHRTQEPPNGLTPQQRLLAAAVERARYVVPVTVHPDMELPEGAPAEAWERFEPHVDRVQAPHNILAWDRHYA